MSSRIRYQGTCIGVEISQRQQPGAICVTELQDRGGQEVHHGHWVVRYLERLPAGTRLPEISNRLKEIVATISQRQDDTPQVLINATGLGKPVVSLLQSQIPDGLFYTIYFNQGDRRAQEGDLYDRVTSLGKAYLVSAVQTALQTERLHMPGTEECTLLADELLSFQIDIQPDANEKYGSFRVGTRDEMVNALGLTVQHELGLSTGIGGAGDDDEDDTEPRIFSRHGNIIFHYP